MRSGKRIEVRRRVQPGGLRRRKHGKNERKEEEYDDDESEENESDEEDGFNWDDARWRTTHKEAWKRDQKELESLRKQCAELSAKLLERKEADKELESLRYKAMDVDSLKETLNDANARAALACKEREEAKEKIGTLLQCKKTLEQEVVAHKQELVETKQAIQALQRQLQMETAIRGGQEKAKQKLARRIDQLEHEIAQQKAFTRDAHEKYKTEQRESERERAFRLVDVHKFKILQDEKASLWQVAEERARQAEQATINERHMSRLLEPLRLAIKQGEELAAQDTKRIADQSKEIEDLREENRHLSANLEQKQIELEELSSHVDALRADVSAMNAQVFRLLKTRPHVASFFSGEYWSPLVLNQLGRGKKSTPHLRHSTILKKRERHLPPVESISLDADPARAFAAYYEQVKGELSEFSRGLDDLVQEQQQEEEESKDDRDCGKKNLVIQRNISATLLSPGSKYLGRGLGVLK